MNASASLRDDPDMKDTPAFLGLSSNVRRFGLLLIMGLFLFALATPVEAQIYQDRNGQEGGRSVQEKLPGRQQSSPVGSPTNLPDWAEPSTSSNPVGDDVQTNAETPPTLPGSPDQVPVDGGLALLAAAGAGYAVRKLNEEGEDDLPA